MKLVLFQGPGASEAQPGLLTESGVVGIGTVMSRGHTPQLTMQGLIDDFERLRPALERLAASAEPTPLGSARLLAPLPWPGKILCSTGGYREHAADGDDGEPRPLLMTLKSGDAVAGPGDTVVLPETDEPWLFTPDVELGVVVKGPAKRVGQADWRKAVFGYTCAIDVMARLPNEPVGQVRFGRDYWLSKSDSMLPLGPCIVTADEIPDPNELRVRSWTNGEPRQDYSMVGAEYSVPRLIEFATAVMTLHSGDLIVCGTSPQGAGPIQDGDRVEAEIDGIGRLVVTVSDPQKRTWERGVLAGGVAG
jgi:2-keto-4-pentenoate hydratase/2-oxohepta-3-ene-1,7-dioic acid hydratase in catechol pathway